MQLYHTIHPSHSHFFLCFLYFFLSLLFYFSSFFIFSGWDLKLFFATLNLNHLYQLHQIQYSKATFELGENSFRKCFSVNAGVWLRMENTFSGNSFQFDRVLGVKWFSFLFYLQISFFGKQREKERLRVRSRPHAKRERERERERERKKREPIVGNPRASTSSAT